LFKSTALVGTDGLGTGVATAISLATGHLIGWTLPGGGGGPAILSLQTSGAPVSLYFDNGSAYLFGGAGALLGANAAAPAPGATSMFLRVNSNGGVSTVPVSLGAADSGGAGYRVLRVAN
jgi:hypothetical protein